MPEDIVPTPTLDISNQLQKSQGEPEGPPAPEVVDRGTEASTTEAIEAGNTALAAREQVATAELGSYTNEIDGTGTQLALLVGGVILGYGAYKAGSGDAETAATISMAGGSLLSFGTAAVMRLFGRMRG